MSISQIEKKQEKIQEKLLALQEEARMLEQKRQEELDAQSLRVIKKLKISAEELQILEKASEAEIKRILATISEKEKEHVLY